MGECLFPYKVVQGDYAIYLDSEQAIEDIFDSIVSFLETGLPPHHID